MGDLAFFIIVAMAVTANLVGGYLTEGPTDHLYLACKERAAKTRKQEKSMDYSEEAIEWICIQNLLRPAVRKGYTYNVMTDDQTVWLETLMSKIITHANARKQSYRVRKEYRALPDSERHSFHNAVNKLHNDTHKYSALVTLYAGESGDMAHESPAFLPWHRVYLLLFEEALREYDSKVTVPYWDSSMDSFLSDATKSNVWSDEFFGNGDGFVTTGPFANWTTTEGTPLLRNIGEAGRLVTPADIKNVFESKTLSGISYPNGKMKSNLETIHGAVHLWVGGDMAQLTLAPNDPAFFVNLAFFDLLWEEFRNKQLTNEGVERVNPYFDWPNTNDPLHNSQRLIGLLPATPIIMGLHPRLGRHIYTYAPRATCSAGSHACGSKYLECFTKKSVCVPVVNWKNFANDKVMDGIQNMYCVNKICDTKEWVFANIDVVHSRAPNYQYDSYNVDNSAPDYRDRIYSSAAFSTVSWFSVKYQKQVRTPEYVDCAGKGRMMKGRVNIVAYGLTYNGIYRDYVVVDQRMSLYRGTGFVAFKRPMSRQETVRTMVRAYDECGRECAVACHIDNSKYYRPCSGIMQTTRNFPVAYSNTLHEAMDSLWEFTRHYNLPIGASKSEPYLRFYCESNGQFPWYNYPHINDPNPQQSPGIPLDKYRTLWTWRNPLPGLISDGVPRFIVPTSTARPIIKPAQCYLEGYCYQNAWLGKCRNCTVNDLKPCPDIYDKYLHCSLAGEWVVQQCPPTLYFSCQYPVCDWPSNVLADPKCKKAK